MIAGHELKQPEAAEKRTLTRKFGRVNDRKMETLQTRILLVGSERKQLVLLCSESCRRRDKRNIKKAHHYDRIGDAGFFLIFLRKTK